MFFVQVNGGCGVDFAEDLASEVENPDVEALARHLQSGKGTFQVSTFVGATSRLSFGVLEFGGLQSDRKCSW
jgi:hypothetical protein